MREPWVKKYIINMRTKFIAFVPQWIEELARRNGLSGSDLVRIEKLAPVCSLEDLASLLALGYNSKIFTSVSLGDDSLRWGAAWRASTKDARLHKLVEDAVSMACDEQYREAVLSRLFEAPQPISSDDRKVTSEVSLLGDEGVKVLLLCGRNREDYIANSRKLFQCIVEKLYVYEEYHMLMTRDVGRTYIETLL